ncbi:MAG: hypothetical protein Q9192_002201 [Flavoplaca navasiana]
MADYSTTEFKGADAKQSPKREKSKLQSQSAYKFFHAIKIIEFSDLIVIHTGNTGGSVHVTPCQDGSYCCGAGTEGNSCCAQGNGVFLANNGQTTNVNPSSTSAQNTATSSSTQTLSSINPPGAAVATSQTGSAPSAAVTKTTEKTTNNAGAIAGGVVGGFVLAALVVVAGLWFLRKRKTKETAEKGPWIPYATGSKPGYFAEVEGANTRMELPAPVGTEMPTEDSRMKKYQVHELQ